MSLRPSVVDEAATIPRDGVAAAASITNSTQQWISPPSPLAFQKAVGVVSAADPPQHRDSEIIIHSIASGSVQAVMSVVPPSTPQSKEEGIAPQKRLLSDHPSGTAASGSDRNAISSTKRQKCDEPGQSFMHIWAHLTASLSRTIV
jgi:hypothetical protein